MEHYIPPYCPPCELYWQTILAEGPLSTGSTSGMWEWVEASAIPPAVWDRANELERRHTVLELVIDSYNRGGLIAYWKGIECFIPASHLIDYPFPADPEAREACFETYVGKTLRLCLIEVEPSRNRILLSERQIADCEIKEPEWPDWLCIGSTCQGEVTSVRPFGAFVDIGPLEGMIHISEISWGRVRHPEDFVEPGQKVRVKILSVDLDHQRVGLSLKRLCPNPWDTVEEHFAPGDIVTGTIASIERFGIFVQLAEGIEGLLHISALDCVEEDDLHQLYCDDEAITVQIVEVTPDEHRIALRLAATERPHATA
jgi:small subunit ribosomal protein S1